MSVRIGSGSPQVNPQRQAQDLAQQQQQALEQAVAELARALGVDIQELLASNPDVAGGQAQAPAPQAEAPRRRPAPIQPDAEGRFPRGGTAKPPPRQRGVDAQQLQAQLPAAPQQAPARTEGAAAPQAQQQQQGGLSGVDRIIDHTARTEGGGRYDAWNPDDAGHGVSYGLIQFNQKAGSLPNLMQRMHDTNPARFNEIMGPHAQNMQNESWVRSANLNSPDIKQRMLTAARDPQFQQVQRDLARDGYFNPARQMGEQYGITSERGVAMLFDSCVQNGVGGTRGMLRQAAAGGGSEHDILSRFADRADAGRWGGNRRHNILNDPNLSDGPIGSAPTGGGQAPAPTQQTGGTAPTHPGPDRNVHVVRPGDTLSGIAAQHGTSWQELARINHLSNPNLIRPGQIIKLPGEQAAPAPVSSAPPPPPASQPSGGGSVTVKRGDTLSGIAARHGTTWQELARINHLSNPNLIHPGQVIRLPGGAPRPADNPPANNPPPANVPAPHVEPGRYDGRTPAPGTTSQRAWVPADPPLHNGPGDRSAQNYSQVLNQFAVGNNPRYSPRDGNTYCNIYAWDATKAMGAEIPHWVDGNGNSVGVGQGRELDANATNRWLNQHGDEHGWRQVSAAEAQRLANEGHPAVASWNNPGGIGHIAMVRPGEMTSRGVAIAQAGGHNFNQGHLQDGFGNRHPEYWVHN